MKATAHLLCGRIGSGKTTFAKTLEKEVDAVRFTHDEWSISLFGQNPPEELYREYFDRVETLMWTTAQRVLRAGTDVILDFGFWTRESRDLARDRAAAAGAIAKFYNVSCPRKLALERALQRSVNPPADSLWIDDAAFARFDALFEPMQDDEDHVYVQGAGS